MISTILYYICEEYRQAGSHQHNKRPLIDSLQETQNICVFR
jgi:hypothetical protein